MRRYPIRDDFKPWDFLVTQDRINGGIGLVPVSAILKSPDNQWVIQGTNGVGVPEGGTTGQVLKKSSSTDYETEWADASAAASVEWADVSSKPTEFPPSSHTHSISSVTGLQTALDGKQPVGTYLTSESIVIGTSAPTPATGVQVLWVDTTGGNVTLNLVTGD